jgi:hypothetical protein
MGWKYLPHARAEQHHFRFECAHVRGVRRGEFLHTGDWRTRRHRRCADDHRSAIYRVVDFHFARRVGANEVQPRSRILSESHTVKIRIIASGCSLSTLYFRIGAPAPPVRERAPMLEQLLARADAPLRVTDWRADAFRIIAPQQRVPAVATAALRASSAALPGAWVFVATPVHWLAGMSSVSLAPDGILALGPAEADALAGDFNRRFGGAGARLQVGREGELLCVFDAPLRAETSAPEELLHHDVWSCMPRGPDSARVRRLMSEIELFLFDHALNESRRRREALAVSALWLWGGGDADEQLPAVHGWTAGNDPLFAAFAAQAHYPARVGPCLSAGSGVVVIAEWPGSPAWREAEERWLAPAVVELRSARVQRLDLSAGDRCFSVSPRGTWRFWRRPRPWWESFGLGGGAAGATDGDA